MESTTIYGTNGTIEIELPKSKLTRNQKKKYIITIKNSNLYPELDGKRLTVEIRYDDCCYNGENSFAITGSTSDMGGCIHDLISEQLPELKKYMKWHLCDTKGPMHYIPNSMYRAEETLPNTIITGYDKRLKFGTFPMLFENPKLIKFLETYQGAKLEIIAVKHPRDPETFSSNYTFECCATDWYKCLFNSLVEAEEMKACIEKYKYKISEVPSRWKSAKNSDLAAARRSAIWEDAELSDFTEEKLVARLPKLLEEFKADMIELGFTY